MSQCNTGQNQCRQNLKKNQFLVSKEGTRVSTHPGHRDLLPLVSPFTPGRSLSSLIAVLPSFPSLPACPAQPSSVHQLHSPRSSRPPCGPRALPGACSLSPYLLLLPPSDRKPSMLKRDLHDFFLVPTPLSPLRDSATQFVPSLNQLPTTSVVLGGTGMRPARLLLLQCYPFADALPLWLELEFPWAEGMPRCRAALPLAAAILLSPGHSSQHRPTRGRAHQQQRGPRADPRSARPRSTEEARDPSRILPLGSAAQCSS